MSREIYDSIEAENFSAAKHILTSPAAYVAERENPPTEEEKKKFAVGTLVHAMSLEGKNLLDLYAIKPEGMSFAKTEGKAWRARQTKPILTEKEAAGVPAMAEAICEHAEAAALLAACGEREKIVTANLHGVPCKSLLDGVGWDASKQRGFLDLKTTGTGATDEEFAKKVIALHYDMQLAWYEQILARSEGLDYRPWCAWIVVETFAPYEVEVYYPPKSLLESGARKVERALALLKACRASGEWPKRSTGVGKTLRLSKWQESKLEEAA